MNDLKFAAAVAWSHVVVDSSSMLMQVLVEEGTLTMITQASIKAVANTCSVCRNHGPW